MKIVTVNRVLINMTEFSAIDWALAVDERQPHPEDVGREFLYSFYPKNLRFYRPHVEKKCPKLFNDSVEN